MRKRKARLSALSTADSAALRAALAPGLVFPHAPSARRNCDIGQRFIYG